MKISRISSLPNFKMRLTKEVEKGFNDLKDNTKDFYGEQSQEYKTMCNNQRILKQYGSNYVVGVGAKESFYSDDDCYYFMIKKDGESEIDKTCFCSKKDQLYSPGNLRWLALHAFCKGDD